MPVTSRPTAPPGALRRRAPGRRRWPTCRSSSFSRRARRTRAVLRPSDGALCPAPRRTGCQSSGPDAPRWSWQGNATEIRYGGVPEGVDGPSLVAGSWWSVAAIGGDGTILALSELRAASPAGDTGPEPAWASGPLATSVPTAAPAEAAGPCEIVSTDEITAAIQGDWGTPEDTSMGAGDVFCTWTSAHGSLLSVSIGPAGNYNPEGWGADEEISGLGSKAYRVNHGWDRRIGWVHDDRSVTLTIDYTKVDKAGYLALAHLVDGRLP